MPEAAVAPPPAAIPPAAAPAPAAPAAPDKTQPTAVPSAKPGSAKDRMQQELMAKAKPVTPEPPKATEPPPAAPDLEAEPPAGTPEDKKAKPWRIVDQYKKRTAQLEKELADARTNALPEAEVKSLKERAESAQKKAEALESEMRFIDYSKSEEFQTKYVAPYEAAWKRAIGELKEIQIADNGEGTKRNVNAQDLLELVNLPLGQARELADKIYGPFADDVMGHRKEIRTLFDTQNAALEDAKTNGAKTLKERQEAMQRQMAETSSFIKKTWDEVNTAILSDENYGHYFKPVEGDQEGNQRLAKGFELADRAFSENPNQPNLTPEQRRAIVKRHAALRNRAAAFGRLVHIVKAREAKIAELTKELEQFKASEPGAAPRSQAQPGAAPAKASDRLYAELQKLAK